MKIQREGFLAAVMAIAAANTAMGCKAKIGDDATPEGANGPVAEGLGSPTIEGVASPANRVGPVKEAGLGPVKEAGLGPIKPLTPPVQEAPGWGAPANTAPTAPVNNGWGSPPPPPPTTHPA